MQTKQSLYEREGQVLELYSYQIFLHVMTSNDFLIASIFLCSIPYDG